MLQLPLEGKREKEGIPLVKWLRLKSGKSEGSGRLWLKTMPPDPSGQGLDLQIPRLDTDPDTDLPGST